METINLNDYPIEVREKIRDIIDGYDKEQKRDSVKEFLWEQYRIGGFMASCLADQYSDSYLRNLPDYFIVICGEKEGETSQIVTKPTLKELIDTIKEIQTNEEGYWGGDTKVDRVFVKGKEKKLDIDTSVNLS